jgi:hypothetical protein
MIAGRFKSHQDDLCGFPDRVRREPTPDRLGHFPFVALKQRIFIDEARPWIEGRHVCALLQPPLHVGARPQLRENGKVRKFSKRRGRTGLEQHFPSGKVVTQMREDGAMLRLGEIWKQAFGGEKERRPAKTSHLRDLR